MLKKIWRNRIEFYPYFTILFFWFFGAFLQSLMVKNQPGIVLLGLVTLLPVGLIFLAVAKTYGELSETAGRPGPAAAMTGTYPPDQPSFDRNFAIVAFGLVIAVSLATTYLHFYQPHIFRTPSNTDIASWRYPPFEQTHLYDQMNAAQRETFLAKGVPEGENIPLFFVTELMSFFLGALVFKHSLKHFGFWMSSCFLIGSFVFTGLEESMFIIGGRFLPPDLVNVFGEPVCGTYWFTKSLIWFFECPFKACVGWYYIAYTCVLTAAKVFPRRGLLFRAAVGGLIAMGIDLWMDPVVTSPEFVEWVWPKGGHLIVFGIPDSNFIGWFNLIFLFAIFWELLPGMAARWGRSKATLAFFAILIATELAIAVFMVLYSTFVGLALAGMGFEQAVHVPSWW